MPPKKSNALIYVLVGCGGLFVLGLIITGIAGFLLYKSGKEFAKNQPRIEKTRTTTTTTKPSPTDSEPGSGSRSGGKSLSGAPSWVVIYPGATVDNQFSSTSGDSKSGGCTLKTDDSVSSVLDFYEEHMKSEGLKVTKTTSGSTQTIVGFSKDYVSQMLTVSTSEINGRQSIVLAYTYKE